MVKKIFGAAKAETAQQKKAYRIREKLSRDLRQTQFFNTEAGETDLRENPNKYAVLELKNLNPYEYVTCPFCLARSLFRQYLISTKKGYDRGKGKCPVCDNGVQFKTLVFMKQCELKSNPNGPENYAKWVWEYRRSGFWQKVQPLIEIRKKRLYSMGWTSRFWEKYKELRGDKEKEADEKRFNDMADDYENSFKMI
jgi:hypothetical protein